MKDRDSTSQEAFSELKEKSEALLEKFEELRGFL